MSRSHSETVDCIEHLFASPERVELVLRLRRQDTGTDGGARFVLGAVGENPLVCFGVNSSTATPTKLDPTVTRVRNFASANGFDSWVMLNVYPQISTDPKGMHREVDLELKIENERQITQLLAGRSLTLLAAWDGLVASRKYLPSLLGDIVNLAASTGSTWTSLGNPLGTGHPRHPSRAPSANVPQSFDLRSYLHGVLGVPSRL